MVEAADMIDCSGELGDRTSWLLLFFQLELPATPVRLNRGFKNLSFSRCAKIHDFKHPSRSALERGLEHALLISDLATTAWMQRALILSIESEVSFA
jgi:hypothetical protein